VFGAGCQADGYVATAEMDFQPVLCGAIEILVSYTSYGTGRIID
jgi:hypothetical protein